MSSPEIEVVLAGARGFALALVAPVEERVGIRPQVATDPAHALVFARGPGGIVVVEFLGEDTLSAVKDLVLDGEGVRIVAAVPAAQAAAEGPLRALGVEPVRWDGRPHAVVEAVERQIASASEPPPSRAKARAAVRPAATPVARSVPAKNPAARAGAPVAPRKQAPAVAGPPRPAPTPTRPAAIPAARAVPAAAPAVAPARPAAAPSAAPRPALRPSRPVAAVRPPPSPPAVAPAPDDLEAALDDVFGGGAAPDDLDAALDDVFGGAPAPAPAVELADDAVPFDPELAAALESLGAQAKDAAAPGASDAPAAAAAPGLFDDLRDAHGFDVDVDDAGPRLEAAPESAGAPWPTAVPDAVEAADALGRALLGEVPAVGTPLAAVADVLASLSDLERAVFSGAPQPIDTEPVRRAAVMRVRVAVALATAPAPGGTVDEGAVSAFLADIDALLSDVNTLAAGAPPAVQASLETMRNALVKEAIDFSEAVQRAAPAEALPEPAPRKAPATRVVSVASQGEIQVARAEAKRRRRMYVVLAVIAIATAAYHGSGFLRRRHADEERPTRSGAPAGAIVATAPVANAPVAVRSTDGKPFSGDELKRMREEEALKGNVVRETAPGSVLILPKAMEGTAPEAPPAR